MKTFRLIAFLLIAFLLSACSFSLAADVTPPPGYQPPPAAQAPESTSGPVYALVPPSPASGEPIYAEKCAPCHGSAGLGDGPQAAQLPNPVAAIGSAELARQAPPAEWYRIVSEGNMDRFMPPFPSLSDGERWDVVAYAYTLSTSEAALEQGQALYEENCAACHGDTGWGDGPQATAGIPDFTDQAYMAGRSEADFYTAIQEGVPTTMPAFAGQFSEDETWAVAGYVRSFMFTGEALAAVPAATPEQGAALAPEETPGAAAEIQATGPVSPTESTGMVSGIVVNESGGEIPEGVEVMLHGFDQMQMAVSMTTTLQANGAFTFEDVDMPAGRVFLASLEYGGATYSSDVATVAPGHTKVDLPISVYDATTDTSGLVVDRLHLFFEFTPEETLRVIQLYVVSNPGESTIVAPEPGEPVLTFQLPPGATNLEFQDGIIGGRYLETPGGFGDTQPVYPGTGSYQVLYAFEMPYERRLDFVQPVTLPANAVVVLVPEGSLKVEGEALTDAGVRNAEGVQYHMYNLPGLAAGEEISLELSGQPGSGIAGLSSGSSTDLVIGLGSFGLVLVAAGLLLYRRNRMSSEDEQDWDDEEAPVEAGEENAETVMDAILALDDLYKAGELPEDAYLQRRGELKARLKELLD